MEFAEASITKRGNSLHVTHGDDSGLHVVFYNESVEQSFESEQQGHPVYKDVPYVHILFPGDRTKEVKRPVKAKSDESTPSDGERWPRQWEAFKAQSEEVTSGIPITEWPPITKSQALALKSVHIHTLEQLAAVADTSLTWMGAREMQAKARVWLANAVDGAEALRLKSENDGLRADIDQLKKQFAELAAGSKGKKSTTKETE